MFFHTYNYQKYEPKARAGGRPSEGSPMANVRDDESRQWAGHRRLSLWASWHNTTKPHAILTGLSRKSYWHLAKTLSTNMGLSKAFLEKPGLASIRTLRIQIHYPVKAS